MIPLGMIANPGLIRLETDVGGALLAFGQMCVALAFISYALIAVRNPWLEVILVIHNRPDLTESLIEN